MKSETLAELIKLLVIGVIFVAPLIIKFLKKAAHKQGGRPAHLRNPAVPRHPKPKPAPARARKQDVNFNEIISELFGAPIVEPVQPPPKHQKKKDLSPEITDINTEKFIEGLPTEEKAFKDIDPKKNVVEKIERKFSLGAHLNETMTSKDWQKAIILKEILEPPLALR